MYLRGGIPKSLRPGKTKRKATRLIRKPRGCSGNTSRITSELRRDSFHIACLSTKKRPQSSAGPRDYRLIPTKINTRKLIWEPGDLKQVLPLSARFTRTFRWPQKAIEMIIYNICTRVLTTYLPFTPVKTCNVPEKNWTKIACFKVDDKKLSFIYKKSL